MTPHSARPRLRPRGGGITKSLISSSAASEEYLGTITHTSPQLTVNGYHLLGTSQTRWAGDSQLTCAKFEASQYPH